MRRILGGLVLAAVLAMHGVPMLFAGGGTHGNPPASDHAMATAALVDEAMAEPAARFASMPTWPSFDMPSEQVHGSPAMPDPDSQMHAWAACLAVLLAGLTLLVSVAVLRRTGLTKAGGAGVRPQWPRGWARIPRPPDLFALCLLRT